MRSTDARDSRSLSQASTLQKYTTQVQNDDFIMKRLEGEVVVLDRPPRSVFLLRRVGSGGRTGCTIDFTAGCTPLLAAHRAAHRAAELIVLGEVERNNNAVASGCF